MCVLFWFQVGKDSENYAQNDSVEADEILSEEDRLQAQLDALTPQQRDMVEQVHAVVSDFPKSWALQALNKNVCQTLNWWV